MYSYSYNKKAKVESDSPPPRFFTKGNIKSELFCTFFFHGTKCLADISRALSDSFLELHKVSLARHLSFTPMSSGDGPSSCWPSFLITNNAVVPNH